MHDVGDLARDALARGLVESQAGLLDVGRKRHQPVGEGVLVPEEAGGRVAQPAGRLGLVAGAHRRDHGPVRALQVPRQDLHSDEPGCTCEEHCAFHRHLHGQELSASSSSTDSWIALASSSTSGRASASA